jgi:hypothetical protein
MRKAVLLLSASALVLVTAAFAQDDAQSLGSVARQVRQQKEQAAKAVPSKDPQAADAEAKAAPAQKSRVINNENLPHAGVTTVSTEVSERPQVPDASRASGGQAGNGEQWRSQILEQKAAVATLQHEVDSVSASIHFAGGNCVSNCAQWNERQQQKQQQVDAMKTQLDEQKKRLEEMQETARKQGFGSSVYEP